jgi:O-acetyl-ADP-ribose deacetylase (regulator of RNase III)
MIEIIHGDLLQSDCTVIGHQTNCLSTMGSGIAKQIAAMYPEAARADKQYPEQPKNRLGKCSYAVCSRPDGETVVIFNLYGQYDYGRQPARVYTNYDALRSALNQMMLTIAEMEKSGELTTVKIGLPYRIGAGLAKGDWNTIEKIIQEVSEQYGRTIYLYRLDL